MLNGRIAPGLYAPRGAWYTLPYKSPYAVSRVTRALMRRTGRYFGLQLALDYLHVEANAFDHTQSCAISAVHISADNRFLFLSLLAQHAEQDLRNGRASVCRSVPSFVRHNPLLQVCCCAPGEEEISIDCCTAGAQHQRRRGTAFSSKCEQ